MLQKHLTAVCKRKKVNHCIWGITESIFPYYSDKSDRMEWSESQAYKTSILLLLDFLIKGSTALFCSLSWVTRNKHWDLIALLHLIFRCYDLVMAFPSWYNTHSSLKHSTIIYLFICLFIHVSLKRFSCFRELRPFFILQLNACLTNVMKVRMHISVSFFFFIQQILVEHP